MLMNEKLFDQFPPVTTKEWMDKINEGFEVKPFYRMEDIDNLMYINSLPGEYPYIRGTKIKNNSWNVRQNIEVYDYSDANKKALTILMKGIDSLGFIIIDPETVSENNFKILFHNIHIENIEINFLCNGKAIEILDLINIISTERGLEPSDIHGGNRSQSDKPFNAEW
jgi:methylmalonyl-CoA mutase